METSEATLTKPQAGAQSTGDKVANAVSDAASNAKPTIDRLATMAHDAVDKAAAAAAPAAEWVSSQGQDFAAMERKLVNDTCQYVAANPLKSIGIALAAGFLLSRIIRS
jgi:ElaB/YqjD/DUF883 family membrane-anchored ribosome-binding protein